MRIIINKKIHEIKHMLIEDGSYMLELGDDVVLDRDLFVYTIDGQTQHIGRIIVGNGSAYLYPEK